MIGTLCIHVHHIGVNTQSHHSFILLISTAEMITWCKQLCELCSCVWKEGGPRSPAKQNNTTCATTHFTQVLMEESNYGKIPFLRMQKLQNAKTCIHCPHLGALTAIFTNFALVIVGTQQCSTDPINQITAWILIVPLWTMNEIHVVLYEINHDRLDAPKSHAWSLICGPYS